MNIGLYVFKGVIDQGIQSLGYFSSCFGLAFDLLGGSVGET